MELAGLPKEFRHAVAEIQPRGCGCSRYARLPALVVAPRPADPTRRRWPAAKLHATEALRGGWRRPRRRGRQLEGAATKVRWARGASAVQCHAANARNRGGVNSRFTPKAAIARGFDLRSPDGLASGSTRDGSRLRSQAARGTGMVRALLARVDQTARRRSRSGSEGATAVQEGTRGSRGPRAGTPRGLRRVRRPSPRS